MINYGFFVVEFLAAFIEQITYFLTEELTLFGFPAIYYMLFSFGVCCIYKFLLSPIFSGGVSAGVSDKVGAAVGKATKENPQVIYVKSDRNRGR